VVPVHEAGEPVKIFEPLFVVGRYVCQECGDSQATKFNAREPYRLKHGENRRPHICEVSGSTFGTLSQYKTHMMRKKHRCDRQDRT
jgi:uncharacterized Zn-finger protein